MARQTPAVCSAISRVGATSRACGPPRPGATPSSATTAKAAVLPVPDLARAIKSMPNRPRGMAAAWMGDGRRKPASRRPRATASLIDNSEKSGNSSASTSAVRLVERRAAMRRDHRGAHKTTEGSVLTNTESIVDSMGGREKDKGKGKGSTRGHWPSGAACACRAASKHPHIYHASACGVRWRH
eukprot:scaffold4836_cov127-Isochrysis_galbana.AAC.6